jgi:hypothetical protein
MTKKVDSILVLLGEMFFLVILFTMAQDSTIPFQKAIDSTISYSETKDFTLKVSQNFETCMKLKNAHEYLAFTINTNLMDWINAALDSNSFLFINIYSLLDLAIELGHMSHLSSNFILLLVTDIFDMIPSIHAETFFEYVESRHTKFLHGINNTLALAASSPYAQLLSLCNSLLKTQSKTRNSHFCGRIQFLLSSVFPMCERSGVNSYGHFNTDNKTVYDLHLDAKIFIDGEDIPADPAFYKTFWDTQSYFSDAKSRFDCPDGYKNFHYGAKKVELFNNNRISN